VCKSTALRLGQGLVNIREARASETLTMGTPPRRPPPRSPRTPRRVSCGQSRSRPIRVRWIVGLLPQFPLLQQRMARDEHDEREISGNRREAVDDAPLSWIAW